VGSPQYPNTSAITALKAASALVAEPLHPVAVGAPTEGEGGAGAWSITLEMPMYSVASLSF
jgi:hypothetical protein